MRSTDIEAVHNICNLRKMKIEDDPRFAIENLICKRSLPK